jgi:signal transduction histidine kinase
VWFLPVVLAVVQVVGSIFASEEGEQARRAGLDLLAFVLLVAGPVALVFRRSHPRAAFLAVVGATLAYFALDYPYGPIFLSLIVAVFNLVLVGERLLAIVGVAAVFITIMATDGEADWAHGAAAAAWFALIIIGSEVVRARRERMVEHAHAVEEETRSRESQERLRMAQDLHDVIAHNISLINVQANTALHLIDERPEQARTALTAIKDASKDALEELRSVLGVLRRPGEELPRAPTLSLDHLDDMVARSVAAGVPVELVVSGTRRPLPEDVDRAAFRVVQEALTNVTRHAPGAAVAVRVGYAADAVTVEITNEATTAAATSTGAGQGLAGMTERVTALGGELTAGHQPDGGFRVFARLPLLGPPLGTAG